MVRAPSSWTSYPCAVAACVFACGIVFFDVFDLDTEIALWGLAGAVVLALPLWMRNESPFLASALGAISIVIVFLTGGLRHITYHSLPKAGRLAAAAKEVVIVGRILDDPVRTGASLRFVLAVDGASPPASVLVYLRSPPGDDGQLHSAHSEPSLRRCDKVEIAGRTDRLPRRRNPGEFDYGRYLQRRRIYGRVFVDPYGVRTLASYRGGLSCRLEDLRGEIAERIDMYVVSPPSKAILQALLLGDRRLMDPEVRDQFARTGLLHLLAVSGLHVMIVGMAFYGLVGPVLCRLRVRWRTTEAVRTGSTAALLIGYMVLTGCSASVVRAVIMTLLFLVSGLLQRPSRPMNTLGVAVIVLLAARPSHLYEAGFQLSTTAVWSILAFNPLSTKWTMARTTKTGRYVAGSLLVTFAATAGTLPVSLYHFGQVGLAGLVLNLPAIPITTGTLTAGAAAVVLGEIHRGAGEIFGAAADALATSLLEISTFGDRALSWSLLKSNVDDASVLLLLILMIVTLALWRRPWIRRHGILSCVVVLCVDTAGDVTDPYRGRWMDVVFLDVGQGDATLLRFPDGKTVSIDTGPRSVVSDAGSRVILPQLAHQGIDRLDAVVITHPDADHLGGLPSLLRGVRIDRVVESRFARGSRLYEETNHLLDSLHVRRRHVRLGDTLNFSEHARAYVLYPPDNLTTDEANAHSIVLLVRYGSTSVLLTGDAPDEAEYMLVRRFGELIESDILKVGHHGSHTSSSSAFLLRVRGDVDPISRAGVRRPTPHAIISVAAANRFGLPDEDVIERLETLGFNVQSTANRGAVWFRLDGTQVRQIAW